MTETTKDIKYSIGITLLTLGAIGLTFFAFFAFIGLPVFLIGIVLLLLSKKSIKRKLIILGSFGILIVSFWFVWNRIKTVGPEIFNIPIDYNGKVVLIFKPGCGEELLKSKNGYVYNIPKDGIMIINKELKTGFIDHQYRYVSNTGEIKELPKMDVRDFNEEWTLTKNQNEPSRNKLGIFHWGRTGIVGDMVDANGKIINKNQQYDFQEFYVATYEELDSKFGFKYDKEFDIRTAEKLKNCK